VESGLATVGLLRAHGLAELVRRYKVVVTRHPALPNLVHLYADVRSTPLCVKHNALIKYMGGSSLRRCPSRGCAASVWV
jgi:hypothetical protein